MFDRNTDFWEWVRQFISLIAQQKFLEVVLRMDPMSYFPSHCSQIIRSHMTD